MTASGEGEQQREGEGEVELQLLRRLLRLLLPELCSYPMGEFQ